jgi:hypothetical protein
MGKEKGNRIMERTKTKLRGFTQYSIIPSFQICRFFRFTQHSNIPDESDLSDLVMKLVGDAGFEPTAFDSGDQRSIHLS